MTNQSILFATGNQHKVDEVKTIIGDSYQFQTLKDINWTDEIIEDGTTFHQNAFIKASTLYTAGNSLVLSEDSGIEVTALENAPGIYSARYASMHDSDLDNTNFLLNNLEGIRNRNARFIAVVCLINAGEVKFFKGEWYGKIADAAYGKGGFGYDPIFIPEGHEQTTAELGDNVKRKESHRSKAFLQFKTYWEGRDQG